MSRKTVCKCGKQISKNTYKFHIKSPKCPLDEHTKSFILSVLDLKTQHQYGWLISDGKDAVGDELWFMSVIDGITSVSDWSMVPPRKHGEVTPSAARQMSKNRTGKGNPSVTSKTFEFTKEQVTEFGVELFKQMNDDLSLDFGDYPSFIERNFPHYRFLMCEEFSESKKKHKTLTRSVIGMFIDIPDKELHDLILKRRGKRISVGQRKSKKFMDMASKMGAQLISSWRVSNAHKHLYSKVLQYDPNAKIEYRVVADCGKSFSYDIYSPLFGGVIEMHGRIWHELSEFTPKTLLDLVTKNVKNDQIKKDLAGSLGMRYAVFWDDEQSGWDSFLEVIYGGNSNEVQGQVG